MLQYSLIIRYCFSISSLIISFSFYSSIGLTSFNGDSRAPSYHVNNLSPSDIKGPCEWHPNIFVYKKQKSHACLSLPTYTCLPLYIFSWNTTWSYPKMYGSSTYTIMYTYYSCSRLLIFNISVLTPLFKESYMRVSLNSTWSVNSRPTHN